MKIHIKASTAHCGLLSGLLSLAGVFQAAAQSNVTFAPAVNYPMLGTNASYVAIADLDGDGKADIAVTNQSDSRPNPNVSILRGAGNGSFQNIGSYGVGSGPLSVAVGDVNGDGKMDLAVGTHNSGAVAILLGNGSGGFAPSVFNFLSGGNVNDVKMGDFNNDGWLDLAVSDTWDSARRNTVRILLGNGTATFAPAVSYQATNPGIIVARLAVVDINHDGKLDLAIGSQNSGTVSTLLGNGNGTFGSPVLHSVGNNPVSVIAGDFDGDGNADIAASNNASSSVTILRGNGDGTFQAPIHSAAPGRPTAIASGDFNGDGRLDLAVTAELPDRVLILTGDGTGAFPARFSFIVGSAPVHVGAGDFNGDGKPDLAVANLGTHNASVLLNTTVFPDSAPIANAGADFSVNEGQAVALDGTGSSDPENDPLTYAWTQVPGGTAVTLTGANTASPTFTAPVVAPGGETLSFDLTVTANGKTSTDTVSVTVVNVNHPPVADAGADQSIAEGSPVALDGSASFDIDSDVFTHAWTQVSGPAVTLTGADTSGPTFTAPYAGTGGATGVVATLVFELLVDDGYPADAPASGYTFDNVRDRVTVEITNTNNLPIAAAGADQTVDENTAVVLDSSASSDPDSDTLTYAWTQTGGPAITLTGGATATPSFTAPFVSAGGADLTFSLTVDDGYGGTATDSVVIHVQNMNDPPLATAAQPTVALLWPPNHQMIAVGITGVSDPNNNATITITSVTQDEPTNGLGDGDTAVDAVISEDGTVLLRAERSGKGDGRVYRISFTASDLEGSSSGMVKVVVPHSVKKPAIDSSGTLYNSTN
ncbi:MAG TPA: hypothetical protein DDZ88_26550 [Verrucomicrobiales bacterium]|nr:hypothetical protein [Verrucomicrobiales bacterium]